MGTVRMNGGAEVPVDARACPDCGRTVLRVEIGGMVQDLDGLKSDGDELRPIPHRCPGRARATGGGSDGPATGR